MTSRERVRKVLNHEIPDRIPNGLGGCETAGLHVLTYEKFVKLLGLPERPIRMDTFMSNAVFDEDVILAMGGDIILMASPRMCKAPFRRPSDKELWKPEKIWNTQLLVPKADVFTHRTDGTVVWETAGHWITPPGSAFFDAPVTEEDFSSDDPLPDPASYNPPMELPEETLRTLEDTAKRLYEETDLSICLGETIEDLQVQPGGSTLKYMMFLASEPELMKEYLGKATEAALSQLKGLHQAVGKYVDILSIAHDLGDNRGVTIGRPLFTEVYKPFYKELFEGWHKITGMKINLHSCGAVSEILGDFIDCGLDVFNPVQISGNGMDPVSLKQRFSDRLVFWGGCYDAQLYNKKSPDEIYGLVRENIRVFSENGGFILSGVHNLPPDTPAENLRVMLNAWQDVNRKTI